MNKNTFLLIIHISVHKSAYFRIKFKHCISQIALIELVQSDFPFTIKIQYKIFVLYIWFPYLYYISFRFSQHLRFSNRSTTKKFPRERSHILHQVRQKVNTDVNISKYFNWNENIILSMDINIKTFSDSSNAMHWE